MTAADLSITSHSDIHFDHPSVFASTLDSSFANIDWQAPWLCHLNQLGYLSNIITQFSLVEAEDSNINKIENTPDTIAKVLNTADQSLAQLLP